MTIQYCEQCSASLSPGAHFCGNCGGETLQHRREHRRESRERVQAIRTASRVVAWIFVGSLVGMALAFLLIDSEPVAYLVACAIDVAICLFALGKLGANAWRHSLGRTPDGMGISLGLLLPLVSIPISMGYAWLWSDGTTEALGYDRIVVALLFVAVLPALVEEWMCRGVLFVALRPFVGGGLTILLTAVLFAALHGLNGGFVLEMPHRFVMGLLLGWLRTRSASLWPCVLAHFLHNATVVVMNAA